MIDKAEDKASNHCPDCGSTRRFKENLGGGYWCYACVDCAEEEDGKTLWTIAPDRDRSEIRPMGEALRESK